MAIRNDNTADYIIRSADLPGSDPLTISMWINLVVDRNAVGYFFFLTASGGTVWQGCRVGADGTSLQVATNLGASVSGTSLALATWYNITYVRNGSSHIAYLNGVSNVSLTSSISLTPIGLTISSDSVNFINGRFANVKIWTAALSVDEVLVEMSNYFPIRRANLHLWSPHFAGATERLADYSGFGRHWTSAGTLTDEDNPGLAWGWPFTDPHTSTLYTVNVDGSITPSGAMLRQANKIFAGSIAPEGANLKSTSKIFAGAITPAATVLKLPTKVLSASITPTGAFEKIPNKVLSGSVTPSGALQRDTSKIFSGSITPTGSNLKSTSKIFSGSITPTGANLNTTSKIFSGSISATGALLKTPIKVLSGVITATGALLRVTSKVLEGSITASGSLLKSTSKILSGSITPSGALETFKIYLLTLSGSITATGELLKTTAKNFSGSITPTGALLKQAQKVLSGSITPSGALVAIKTYFLELAGSITATGALLKQTQKILSGSITPSGVFVKIPQKVLSGSITAAGALVKNPFKIFSGSIQATGALLRQPKKILAGSISATGTLIKTPQKLFTGTITASGSLLKSTTKVLSGSVTISGSLIKSTKKILAGLIAANGTLTTAIIGEFVMIPGQTARLQYRIQDYQNFWEVYLKRSDANDAWDFYVDKIEAGVRSNEFFTNNVGTPTALRVICYGSNHIAYTLEGGIYTPQVSFSDAFLAAEGDTNTIYSSVIIPVKHTAYQRNPSTSTVLDRE